MKRAELNVACAKRGVKVDGIVAGAGKFADLQIGVGASHQTLKALRDDLKKAEIGSRMEFDKVTNPEHQDYGKAMLVVHSFWNE